MNLNYQNIMKSLLPKFKRKLNTLRNWYIPYNYRLRPEKLIQSSKDYAQKTAYKLLRYHEVKSEFQVDLEIPKEFYDRIPNYQLIAAKKEDHSTTLTQKFKCFVTEVPEGRLFTDNLFIVWVISKNNELIGDVSFQFQNGYPVASFQNQIVKHRFFNKPKKIKGTVCTLLCGGGASINNYFHWMIDVLPRIYLLKKTGTFDQIDFFVVPSCKLNYHKDTLKLLGIRKDQLIVAGAELHLQADQLIATVHPRGEKGYISPKWLVDFHREHFLDKIKYKKDSPKKIYISRKDSKLRAIYNESEVIEYMEQKGFAICVLSQLSFLEKVQLFNQADFIVAPTGAGLTNILYCKKGTKILEVFKSGTHINYFTLAYHMEVEYDFLIGEQEIKHADDIKQGIKKGFIMNVQALKKKVEEMLSN